MSDRQLVTFRTVSAIRPIPGADAIECATVDGWDVVVKKGEFTQGDKAVYFEIDSFLPVSDKRFEFLAKSGVRLFNGVAGVRLRTIKLRGQISQGLLLPLSDFPELAGGEGSLAELLGVQKWEAPIPAQLAGMMRGNFPCFIAKTDQERIQNIAEVLREQANELFEVTVKLDGSSMTIYHRDGEIGVCSRNVDLVEQPANTFWRVAIRNKIPDALRQLGKNLALQGELIGPCIQGNRERLFDHEFYLFDAFDIDANRKLSVCDRQLLRQQLCPLGATVLHAPVVEPTLRLSSFDGDLRRVLAFAEGPSLNAPAREGVVFKRLDGQFSFKVISNSYLLKSEAA